MSESQSVLAAFVSVQSENISLTDSQSVLVAFVGSVAEQISLLDSQSAQAAFIGSVLELLVITDSQCPFGWFKINDDQTPEWGVININVNEIAAYGAFTFGGVPFAGSLNVSGQAPNPIPNEQVPNWTDINDGQSTNWNEVNTDQNC